MKKFICVFFALIFVVGLSACKKKGSETNETKFVEEWTVAQVASDNVFGEQEENSTVWVAKPLASASQAYTDVPIMDNYLTVKKGNYRLSVEVAVEDNVVANENVASSTLAGNIKVVNQKTGKAIEINELNIADFESAKTLQTFTVNFSVAEETEIKCEVAWFNTVEMKIGNCKLEGITKEEYTIGNLEAWVYSTQAKALDTEKLYFFNLKEYLEPVELSREKYDIALLVSCLQGLVNREKPLLYINFAEGNTFVEGKDTYWIDYLRQDGNMLSGKTVVEVLSLGELLDLFKDYYNGYVVWDENVPATSNVACTVSGADNLLPIRYCTKDQSLYDILSSKSGFEVKVDLNRKFVNGSTDTIYGTSVNSTGSAKNDAYYYAIENYLKAGKTNPEIMAFHLDAFTYDKTGESVSYYDLDNNLLTNKDYYVKNKAFFWDLNVTDAIPNDDKTQKAGTDLATLRTVLSTHNQLANGKLIECGGFVPWFIKYTEQAGYGTEGQPGAVDTEWKLAILGGEYYFTVDADAYPLTSMSNASVYSHFQLPDKLIQPNNEKATWTDEKFLSFCKSKGYINASGEVVKNNYIMLYVGDFDSGAWMTTAWGNMFTDQNLGFVPMTIPVNFGSINRVPFIYDFIYSKAANSKNVYFAGDHNGYGYLDLNTLAKKGTETKGSFEEYFNLTQSYNEKFGLSVQSFIINNSKKALTNDVIEALCRTYPHGVVMGGSRNLNYKLADGTVVPWSKSLSFANGVLWDQAIEAMKINFGTANNVNFTQLRTIACNPTFIRRVFDNAEKQGVKMEVLDQYTYFWLLKYHNNATGNVVEIA